MIQVRRSFLGLLLAAGITTAQAETITVTNTNDSGAGSLRQAIVSANANASSTTILINIPGPLGSERIINVPTALPAFTAPVELRIDGGQTGKAVLLAPIINGPGAATTGITFAGGSTGSRVEFITFRNFVFSVVLNTTAVTVANNRFENNQGGIDVRVNNGGNIINSNQFTTTHSAYAIAGNSGGHVITNNGFTGEGISLGGSGNTIGGAGNADPNVFTNVAGNAIYLSNGSGSLIKRNNINGSTGIGILATGTDMTIDNNYLSGNVGYDIKVDGPHSNKVRYNQVTGDNGIFNGIRVSDGLSYSIVSNIVSGGAIELANMGSSSWYGALGVFGNTVVNDPQGVSAHGAISLENTVNANIIGNILHHNASNGVYLYASNNNLIKGNSIYENFRAGVNVGTSLYNKITENIIYYNHADVNGGRTGIAPTSKAAPVISSAKRVGTNFIVSGTGTVAGDSIEIFASDAASRNNTLTQNAHFYKVRTGSAGTTWTVTFPVSGIMSAGDVYVIATATNSNSTTSTFSKAVGVEINGPSTAVKATLSNYFAESIPGASYQWWSTLSISSLVVNGNQAGFTFNQAGSGTVSVGYTDPGTGAWKMYSYAVTVVNSARAGEELEVASVETSVNTFPNPFNSSVKVSLDAIAGDAATLELYNAAGDRVYSSQGNLKGSVVEFGSDLQPGVYTLQIVSENIVKTTKVVKVQ
jgi:parallel beta-helix repeat protein